MKCTKIAAKLVRTFTDRHGLRDLCRELVGVEISKQQQTSDWGAADLTPEQISYAASDVLYLHALWSKLEGLSGPRRPSGTGRSLFCTFSRPAPVSICSAMKSPTSSPTEAFGTQVLAILP